MKKKMKKVARNEEVVAMLRHTKPGCISDRKKSINKKKCRGVINDED